jgi:Cytochrome bd terminal oxidase subunit II
MSTLTLATICAALIWFALIAYAVLGGADFGGGVWDLLARGSRAEKERAAIANALGPVWEANNVWLIFVIVLTWTTFPIVYAAISTALFIPLTLALVGIIFRGAAFGFRSAYGRRIGAALAWGRVFSVASVITPFLLGMVAGAIAGGDIRVHGQEVIANYWTTWTTPFAFACGAFALGLCSVLAATYLTAEAQMNGDRDLIAIFLPRAIIALEWSDWKSAAALAGRRARRPGDSWRADPWALPPGPHPCRGGDGADHRRMGRRAVSIHGRARSDGPECGQPSLDADASDHLLADWPADPSAVTLVSLRHLQDSHRRASPRDRCLLRPLAATGAGGSYRFTNREQKRRDERPGWRRASSEAVIRIVSRFMKYHTAGVASAPAALVFSWAVTSTARPRFLPSLRRSRRAPISQRA